MTRWGSGRVLAAAFAIALCGGWFVQLVLLPVLLPGIHAGHGLLLGGDWVGFHADGVKLAQQIAADGWHRFELRPSSNAPIAVAAVVYLLTGIYEPWILVPVHAAVFALGAVALFNVCRTVLPAGESGSAPALFGIAAYVLFPTSLLMYSQIHKDVWSVAGFFGLAYVWLLLDRAESVRARELAIAAAIAIPSTLSIWLVRPYLVQITMLALAGATAFTLAWRLVFGAKAIVRGGVTRWLGMIGGLAFLYAFSSAMPGARGSLVEINQAQGIQFEIENCVYDHKPENSWLPAEVVRSLNAIRSIRLGQRFAGLAAGSGIDHDVCFRKPDDMLTYLPRALQIGLFAPFPNRWFDPGVSPGAQAMRLVASFEMSVTYALLLGLLPLLLLVSQDARRNVGMIATMAFVNLVILATAIPNVGTVYRMRYGYLLVLVGLGTVGWVLAVAHVRKRSLARLSAAGDKA